MFVLLAFSDKILISIGQDEEVSMISRNYLVTLMPGIMAAAHFDAVKKFLSA